LKKENLLCKYLVEIIVGINLYLYVNTYVVKNKPM